METNDRVYLLLEIEKLNKEIKRLQDVLNSHGISYELSEENIASLKQQLAPVKITIEHARFFYSLFKGRRDVYALRNINKNGKAVYYNFQEAFDMDLSMAKDEIILASPVLSNKSVKEFISYVKVAQYRGTRISVLTLAVKGIMRQGKSK